MPGCSASSVCPVSVWRRVASVVADVAPAAAAAPDRRRPVAPFSISLTAAAQGTGPLNQVLLSLQLAALCAARVDPLQQRDAHLGAVERREAALVHEDVDLVRAPPAARTRCARRTPSSMRRR